jgi:PKD repeat protein
MGHDKDLDSTLTIPVVFHVFHTYGSERISEAQIKDGVRLMNLDFQKRSPDTSSVSVNFRAIIGNTQVRFRLAKKDPSGRCTKGINYIFSNLHTEGGENLKSVVSWDTRKYLNIWVCSNVASGAAAYSYYPGNAPGQSNEGIVTRSNYVGSIGNSVGGSGARTLSHETGHFFNLPHTWGSSNTPGLAGNCSSDDGVADTPNCIGTNNGGCNLNLSTCGSLDNVENIMDYSSCPRMFTVGQSNRMHAALNSNVGFRRALWQSANLISTGTTNDGPGPECPPTPDFRSNFSRVCVGSPITFTQLAYNVDNPNAIQFSWSFPGGNPSTSDQKNPVVTYDQPGSYVVKLTVTNSAGSDSLIRVNFISILPNEPGYVAGESESFELATFPINQSNNLKNWDISGTGNNNWKRVTIASATGSASLNVTNNSTNSGNVTTLISPVYKIDGAISSARIAFKYAFARRTTTNSDRLQVSYSVNCGQSWTSLFNKNGTALATRTTTASGTFIPTDQEWKQENVNMLFLGNNTEFRLRFQFTSGGGNNVYLEDIQLNTITSVNNNLNSSQLSMEVYPNPSEELPTLLLESQKPGSASIQIMDVLGRNTVWEKSLNLPEGQSEIRLGNEMEKPRPGNYWIRLVINDKVIVRQWVVLP